MHSKGSGGVQAADENGGATSLNNNNDGVALRSSDRLKKRPKVYERTFFYYNSSGMIRFKKKKPKTAAAHIAKMLRPGSLRRRKPNATNNNLSSPTTDIVTKEEIVSTLQSNHEQNGENNNAQVKAVSSCQDRVQEEIVSTLQSNHEQKGENDNAKVKAVSSCQDGMQANNALMPFHSNSRELDKIHKVISLRENLLSQTALKVLHRKRDMLSYQRRNIEDEIALCNRNIEAILNGSEDDLGIKLDSIIEACNSETLSGGVSDHERMNQHSQDQNTRKYLKRKRLSEANLSVRDPCQDLDDICHENYWELPTYNISTSNGGFQAAVIVKGVDFECSSRGCTCNTPREARESAASLALTKMRNMVSAS